MQRSLSEIVTSITESYVRKLMGMANPPEPRTIECELVGELQGTCTLENHLRGKAEALRPRDRLYPFQVAMLMMAQRHIVRIPCSGPGGNPDYDLLAIYETEGENEGLYVTDDFTFSRYAKKYDRRITKGWSRTTWPGSPESASYCKALSRLLFFPSPLAMPQNRQQSRPFAPPAISRRCCSGRCR